MAVETKESEVPIEVITARIEGMQLNSASSLDPNALLKAVRNAMELSKVKGFTTFGGLPHDLYYDNIKRRIWNDSVFRICCSFYADALQQEIGIHLLAADNGVAMYEAEKKGSLLEYYNRYGSGKDRAAP
jgi:hypothetical protein